MLKRSVLAGEGALDGVESDRRSVSRAKDGVEMALSISVALLASVASRDCLGEGWLLLFVLVFVLLLLRRRLDLETEDTRVLNALGALDTAMAVDGDGVSRSFALLLGSFFTGFDSGEICVVLFERCSESLFSSARLAKSNESSSLRTLPACSTAA